MTARFHPAPGWPTPPPGWVPPPGWTRPPDWPRSPAGWPFWVDDVTGLPVADPTVRRVAWYARARVLVPAAAAVLLVGGAAAAAGQDDAGGTAAPARATQPSGPTAGALDARADDEADEAAADEAAADAAASASEQAAQDAERDAEAAASAAAQAAAEQAAADQAAAEQAASDQAAADQAAAEQAAAAQAAAERAAATWTVADVVDGDTVDVRQGELTERVRVIGIDTPERGGCGYEQAADVLAGLVLGQDVLLLPGARDDRDSYGRVLRYVDRASDGLDSGRALLDAGLAVARYDSRDGYGSHPREGSYVAADAATVDAAVCAPPPPPPPAAPAPAPAPVAPVPPDGTRAGCDPAYPTVCLPSSPDVDCGEISHRYFPVLAPDPHRLDGSDGDGVGCESG